MSRRKIRIYLIAVVAASCWLFLLAMRARAEDPVTAAAAFEERTPSLASPIVDEVRAPAYLQWITFLRGDLVAAEHPRKARA